MNRKERRAAEAQHKARPTIIYQGKSYAIEEAARFALKEHSLYNIQVALELYNLILAQIPDAGLYNNRGAILKDLQRYDEALASCDRAIALKLDLVEAYNNRGVILEHMLRYEEALASYDKTLALKPGFAEVYVNKGTVLRKINRFDESLAHYGRAIALNPGYADAYINRGLTLQNMKRYEEALLNYDQAITLNPASVYAHAARGTLLREQTRYAEALESYDRAIALKPDFAELYNDKGIALQSLGQRTAALAVFDRALSLKPDYAEVHYNRGLVLQELLRFSEALPSFERARALQPDIPYLTGNMLYAYMNLCQWAGIDILMDRLGKEADTGQRVSIPFPMLSTPLSLSQQNKCLETYVNDKYPSQSMKLWSGKRYAHEKIRIAYVSADFREHAMPYLMAGVFEQHDKNRFEIYGISLMPEENSVMGRRVKASFDHFIDVSQKSDREVAQLLHDLEIDIVIDLMGFTASARPGIFAYRPAPLQINYLGYPGTMQAEYIDYIIADAFLIPPPSREYYSEKIIYLPDCFQANDDRRFRSKEKPIRARYGLPERGFVFCCFNNSYKINPMFFDIWMRLMKNVPDSVLWLLGNDTVQSNLRREASDRVVDPSRLVFATKLSYDEHLARLSSADLFLDTLPFNAGATANDALWAGVPLLTCAGEAFVSRMAGSLLTALGLPELITENIHDYEALALTLAREPERLADIKSRLTQNRDAGRLFNTKRFTHHLEDAYIKVWERQQAELKPEHVFAD